MFGIREEKQIEDCDGVRIKYCHITKRSTAQRWDVGDWMVVMSTKEKNQNLCGYCVVALAYCINNRAIDDRKLMYPLFHVLVIYTNKDMDNTTVPISKNVIGTLILSFHLPFTFYPSSANPWPH